MCVCNGSREDCTLTFDLIAGRLTCTAATQVEHIPRQRTDDVHLTVALAQQATATTAPPVPA